MGYSPRGIYLVPSTPSPPHPPPPPHRQEPQQQAHRQTHPSLKAWRPVCRTPCPSRSLPTPHRYRVSWRVPAQPCRRAPWKLQNQQRKSHWK
ncbi:hypothetical protein chiPu_0024196, partial [Chiloscyllium punctatum]|nr:hypothetical protein [Chiloscyllium punctatum]